MKRVHSIDQMDAAWASMQGKLGALRSALSGEQAQALDEMLEIASAHANEECDRLSIIAAGAYGKPTSCHCP
ncbi:MAG TPA: hypothetical protein VK550_04150 [Polyangiaceae bacterium]|nr:hypothetical protein [Polyangiaceae bacterium]